tara:strand:+ start:964 stop:1746 length:783 start_codon:yes stop_codon:yes gene_type:complete
MLTGKVALITGSTSGIGLGIAKKLSSQGAHIILNGMGEKTAIQALQASLQKDCNNSVLFHPADLTDPNQIEELIHFSANAHGRLDILVNNAGIQHVAPVCDFPIEKWQKIIDLNLSAAFYTARLAIPFMREKKWGRIINMASAHALVASPFKSAYVASKHALAGLSKVIALEVAEENITCNAICPGYVHTPLVDQQIDDTAKARGISRESVIKDVMLGPQATKKFVTIEEIASFASFLCSDAADSITGALLPIDGAWTSH